MYSPIHEGTSLILGQIKFCDLSLYTIPPVQSSCQSPQLSSEPYVQIQNIPHHSFYYDKFACYHATLSGYSSPYWLDEAIIHDFFVRVNMECNGLKEFHHGNEITYIVQLQHDSSRGVFRLMEIRIKASVFLGRIDWIRRNEDIILFLERLSSYLDD
ncbi:1140_t:CDS:1 [Acaulospora morrowiae]|uniref:1140_t:CDS:1 n=1 Tax=Acaulospora morrowiae TaxID=94023 RepID=A0A9N9FN20_9GLOM|nr:1140_t:CDS:1 [Acaulospora morrowiae]